MKKLKRLFATIALWFGNLFKRSIHHPDIEKDHTENIDIIKKMAFVVGMTKDQIESDLRANLSGEDLDAAITELHMLFGNRQRMDRELVRKGRHENNLTFSKALKNNLKIK